MDLIGLLLIVSALPVPAEIPTRWHAQGIASVYYTGKDGKFGGGGLACLWRHPKGPHVARSLRFVAHRFLPCGTILLIRNPRTGLTTYAQVLDRGPYGAIVDGQWAMKIRSDEPGVWRGILDLSPGTAAAIGHNGFEKVQYRRVKALDPAVLVPPVAFGTTSSAWRCPLR